MTVIAVTTFAETVTDAVAVVPDVGAEKVAVAPEAGYPAPPFVITISEFASEHKFIGFSTVMRWIMEKSITGEILVSVVDIVARK